MATKLNKVLKREIELDGKAYMVTIAPEGVKLTEKGKRLGREHTWKELLGETGGASAPPPSSSFGS
jgi:Mn-dependent DtxR family transcriptional regulator